jgi:hypothetical protein
MNVIFENARLRVSFEAGSSDSDEVVLAFTGGRHALAGIDKDDFVKTNRASPIIRDAYYINDLRRSWYNGIRQDVVDVLSPRIEGRRVISLGNSLGGFGALMFSGLFETCDTAIVFAPQYSVRPELAPFETRWEEFSMHIDGFENDTCFLPGVDYARCRKYIFCGANDSSDLMHAEHIIRVAKGDTNVFAVDGCGHDVSFKLKEHGLLGGLIEAAIDSSDGAARIRYLLDTNGVAYETRRSADCSEK